MKNNDAELIHRVLAGDDTAFSVLVRKYQRSVHALVWRKIGDFHIAEDITQDTFLKAYQRLSTLKKPQRFASWLYVIAANHCSTWLRKKRLWTQSLEETNSAQLKKATYSGYVIEENERMTEETQREIVKKLLAKLQESERTVITLYYLGEMTYEEISEFLGVSVAAIKNRLYRARNRLKKEEPMIREALGNYQITPNLTENIMREVSRLKPIAPFNSKPLVPWTIAVSTAVIFLMLGIGNHQYLSRFQKPYSFDAASEMTVELIEAPIVLNLESKPDIRTQLGNVNTPSKSDTANQQPNNVSASVADAESDETDTDSSQWQLPEDAIARFGKGTLTDCVYLPDGNRLAVLSSIGVWIYDVRTGEALDLITEPFTEDMRLSPDGKTLAAASDGSIYLWDLQARKLRSVLVGDTHRIGSLTFSPTRETVAGGTWDNTVQLWNLETGKLLKTLIGHRDLNTRSMSIGFITYSNDGKMLASVGWEDRTIRIWDVETGQLLQTIDERPKRILSVAFSPDSRTLASAEEDSKIRIWDVGTGELLKTLTGHTSEVNTMTYSPDGTTLVSGSWDKTIRFWNASTGKLLKTLTEHTDVVDTVIYAPDGKTVTSMSSYDGTIRFWDAETTKLLKTITGHTGSFGRAVAFSPDGTTLANVGTGDNTIPIRDVQSRQLLRTLTGHTDIVVSVAYSPDGRNFVSADWDGHIRMWNVETGQLEKTLTGHEEGVPSLVYSPDGTTLMSGSWDNTIRIWDVDTGKPLRTIIGNITELEPSQGVIAISLSPDGGTIASATDEKVIRLWDVYTGKHKDSLVGYTGSVAAVAFSPSGTVLASGSDDATMCLWDVETGKLLNTFKEPTKSSVLSVAFSPDGRILASGCAGVIRLRDTFTERSTVTLTGHTTWVRALAFSPDGHILASIDEGGVVMLWDMTQVTWQ